MGVDPHHDGTVLKTAVDILENKTLFKDSFTLYGAFFAYFQAFTLFVFGKTLFALKAMTAFFYGITVFFLYKCWRHFLPVIMTVLSVLLFIGMAPFYLWIFLPWASVYSLTETVIIIYLLIRFLNRDSKKYLIVVGILTAFAFYTRQPVGITLFIAILFLLFNMYYFRLKKKLIPLFLWYFLGLFSIVIPYSLYALFTGAFHDWYTQQLVITIGSVPAYTLTFVFSCLFPKLQHYVWSVMPIVCLILLFSFYLSKYAKYKIIRKASVGEMKLLVFCVIAISSWHQYFPVACIRHIYWGGGIMIGIFIHFFWDVLKNCEPVKKFFVFIIIIGIFFYYNIEIRITNGIEKYKYYTMTFTEKGYYFDGMKLSGYEYAKYTELFKQIEIIKQIFPDKTILNLTNDNLLTAIFGDYVTWGNADPANNMSLTWYEDYFKDTINEQKPIIIVSDFSNIAAGFSVPDYVLVSKIGDISFYMDGSLLQN